jgi:NitT/TauT family transport system permease protein
VGSVKSPGPYYTFALIVALLIVWQLLFLILGPRVLAPPAATFVNAWNVLTAPDYRPDLGESMRAFLIALLIAAGIGVAGGLLVGSWRACSEILEPLLVNFNTVPKVALYPVILLIFGLGLWAKVVFGALHGVIPIMISSIGAVRNVNPIYVLSGRAMHLTRWQMLRRIWAPACVPEMFSGLRLGFSLTLLGTIFGEFFASQKGVGFLLMNAIDLRNIPMIMSLILILVVFAVLSNSALLLVERRLHRLH